MATEANIQESVCLKKGEREENAVASEIFEEKVSELPGNQVKQLEASSYVAEIVNTPLVTGKPTDESGIFFQALSVTMIIADEHSNTSESCKAAKQIEPEEDTIKVEEKAIESVTSSQDAAVEDIKETTEHATIVTNFKEQDLNETPQEFVKEETEGKSVDAQEVTEQCEIRSKNIDEQKSEESVEKIEKDEEIKETKPDVETEKKEQNELLQAITSDAAISTQTKSQVETTEHEEENTQKSDNPLIKEVCEENKDNEHEVVESKESIEEEADTSVKESIEIEELNDEKAAEKEVCQENSPEQAELETSDSTIKKDQGDIEGVTSSQEPPCMDADETTTAQHVTTTDDLKEQDLDEKPKEFIKEETEEKSLDVPEESKECVKEEIEQNLEESVKKTEKEEEIKPDVEIEEKKEQDELLTAITTDVPISAQTKPQVETIEHEEKEQDVNLLEKYQDEDDVTHAQEVTFEESLQEKSHHNEDNEHEVVKSKESIEEEADTLVKESIKTEEPDDEKAIEKEICEISDSMPPSQKDQGDSGGGVTSLQESPSVDVEETATDQHVTTVVDHKEQDLDEKPREFVKEETKDKSLDAPEVSEECEKGAKEEIDQNSEEGVKKIEKEETEEIKRGVEIEEKEEQDELLPAITKDEVKHSAIATVTKDENEDEEKEQEVNVLEKDEGEDDVTSARDVTFEKDLQEENHHNVAEESTEKDTEVTKSSEETEQQMLINDIPSDVCISTQTELEEEATEKNDEEATETGQGLSATQRETIIEEAKVKSVDAREEIEEYGDGANDKNEQKLEECVNETAHSTNEQEEYTEEIKPKVEATEEKDVGISTQTESQQEATKNEENAIESYDGQKEKSDNTVVNEVCEEIDVKQIESEEETTLSDGSNVKTREIVDEDTEETKSSDVITTDVSSSTQTEYIEKAIESKENNDEPLVEEVCEATSSEMAKSEEGVKHSDNFDTPLNADETLSEKEKMEKEDEIKTSEVQGSGDDVTSSQNASNEDIQEATIGQHDTTVAYAKGGQGTSATPKEIFTEEVEDKSIDAEELGQLNEQNVEEIHSSLSETTSQNPEGEIKKEDKDLSHVNVEGTNDDTTEEEKCTLEQEPVEEHSVQDEVSKENVTELDNSTEVEAQEDITPSTSFETSTKDTSNSEEKAEIESLPVKDLEIVPDAQIPELVAKSEDLVLKEECFISETETHLDEEKGTVEKEISSDEKTEFQGGKDDVTSSQNAPSEDIQETKTGQHDTTVTYVIEEQGVSSTAKEILIEEAQDKSIDVEEVIQLGQPNEQNVEESKTITEIPEDEIKKEEKDLSHESVLDANDNTTKEEKGALEHEPVEEQSDRDEVSKENVNDSNETKEVEHQEDITPSASFETSTENASNLEKEKAESGKFPIDEPETVSEVQVPDLVPRSEDSALKEECFISETKTHLDEEKGTVTEEISSDEKTAVQGGGDDVRSSQNASNEDIQETTIGQHDTPVAYVEEEQCVSATPKEILTKETEDKLVDAEETSLKLGQPNEQNVEETISQNPEDEIKKEKDLSHESVEDMNDNTAKEEKCLSEQEPVEEHSERDEGSKDNVADLSETREVEPQEDIKPSTSLETSTEDTLNSEKEKAETENLPKEDIETVSEVQIPELVTRSEESLLKEECFISETKTQLDEEKGDVTEEIASDEKTKVQGGGDDFTSSQNAPIEDIQETTIDQHDSSVSYDEEEKCVSATPKEILKEETEDKSIDVEETSLKLEQPNEQNGEETITQNPEDEIKKEDRDLSHESVEDTNDDAAKEEKSAVEHEPIEEHSGLDEVSKENVTELNETTEVEPQDITPPISLETSTEDASNSEKEKVEAENLPIEDLESVSEVQIPELVPKSEELMLKEECLVSKTKTHLDEEKGIVTKEISSDEQKTEQATEIKQETVKEVCEETSSEKVEFEEGLKLSDSSNIKINEKEISFKDDGEKDQEVNMSTESQGEDNIKSSQIEVSKEKEDLQEKYSHNEGNEGDFIKSGEGVDDHSKEIKCSVETQENTENVITTNSSTQIDTNAEIIEDEEKNDEKAKEDDENETASRDANLEQKQEDIRETDIGEHATTVDSFEEEQSLGTVTKEVLGEAEEGDKSVIAQEETEQHDDGEKDEGEQKPVEHNEEIRPSVGTNEEKEVCISAQNESQEEPTMIEENVIERDDQKENSDNLFVKEVCEESDLANTETEERQASDSSDVKDREIVDEDTEEIKSTDVSSSTQTENIENSTGKGNNDVETIEHDDGQTEKPRSPLAEVVCEATSSEIVASEDGVKHSESFSTTLNENETLSKEEILEKEDDIETSEVKGGGVEVTSSQDTSNEDTKETMIGQHGITVAHVEEQFVSETPKEIAIEEAEDKSTEAEEISLEHEQPNEQNVEETHPCLSETISENPEDEIKKDLSHESVEDTNDIITKEEKGALDHEPVEEHSGLDEVPKESVAGQNETKEVEPQEDITPSISLEASTEDTSNSEKEKAEIEILPIKDPDTVSEVQSESVVPNTEESVLKAKGSISETEPHLDEIKETVTEEISSDEKTEQPLEIKQETVKEVCEETSSEKAEFEGVKLSDTSNVEINEKEIATFKDDDQEVNMSAKSEGKDNITSSQNEESEEKEDSQEKNDHNEGNEDNFIKSGEGVHEDTEEIKYSVETKENAEHAITTTSPTQIEPDEETTEKNGEKAIENDENVITSTEKDLEKKLEDVCSLAQTESKEEIIENKETNAEAIDNEKEQESAVAELQDGEDDVVSSRDAYNEDTKETAIGQDATTPVHFEEELGVKETANKIIGEEVEDKPIHAEEASVQSENEAKDKIEQHEESVSKHVYSCSETIEESIKEEADVGNKEIESKLEAENQADSIEDRTEIKDEAVLTEKVSKELEQTKEQNVDEIEACLTETISENTEDKITKDEDLSNDNVEQINENITKEEKCFSDGITKGNEEQNDSQDEVSKEIITDLNETTAVEPQEDVTPSGSLETSTEDTKISDKAEAVNENLPIEDLESVSEEHIPEVMPKSKDSKTKEECPVSATDIGTVTKEISSYENLETHGSTQQPDNSYSTPGENVTQSEIEGCSEMVKDVILTEIEQVPLEIGKEKEINDFKERTIEEDSYSPELEEKSAENQKELVHEITNSDSIPAETPEVTEVSVDGHIGQEDLQGKEDIGCVSKVTNDVDQEPKDAIIPSLQDAATVESQVDLSNRESTAYPLESEKLATRALESDCDVQMAEVVADSEDTKVKEECVVLATAEYTDEKNVEEQDTKTDEIASAPGNKQETVTEAPTKSDEAKSSDLIIEENTLTEENLEIHRELEPASEPVIDEQVIIETKPQPEQSEITCENITNDQTSESKLEEEVRLAPGNEIKSIESQNETTKNIILTDEVSVETEKEKEINEIEKQVSEKDNSPTELDNTSTPDQKELANEIEYSKPVADANTEVTEVKAEIQTEVEDIKAAEDLSCLSKASSIIETSKVEMHEDTEQSTTIKEVKADSIDEASKDTTVPVLEDSKASELQSTDRELVTVLQTFSEDQTKINERCIKDENQGNFDAEIKDERREKEAVEYVIINEVIVEDEKAKESKSINEEAKLNQLTTETDEVCQIEKSSSRPDELLETKDSVEDTEHPKFIADSLNVKDETLTVVKGPNEESETVTSEFKLEDTVTDKEKETLDAPQADDSAKTTYDSILSPTKTTEDSEIATEIVPECKEVSAILTDNLPEASPDILLAKHEDKITEDPKVLPSLEKDGTDVQKHEKDLDHETEVRTADVVSNVDNQKEQKKETDESIEAVIPVEDVKTSTRELEVGSVDLEAPSVIDATAEKANIKTVETQLESTCDQSKTIEEGSGIKQEALEVDAPKTFGTAATKDFHISQKYVTDDLIKEGQTHPEIQKYEVPKDSTERKILTENIDSSHVQEEPIAKSLIPEATNLKHDTAPVSVDQKEKYESAEPANIVLREPAKEKSEVAKDQQVEKEETGVKTDEEYEEEEDNEDDEKLGSCSDAPVMVEASKDIEVKAHKKSHNILSGVGSKVKHSIAKVKKAITGKSSPTKSPSPKAKDQVVG